MASAGVWGVEGGPSCSVLGCPVEAEDSGMRQKHLLVYIQRRYAWKQDLNRLRKMLPCGYFFKGTVFIKRDEKMLLSPSLFSGFLLHKMGRNRPISWDSRENIAR